MRYEARRPVPLQGPVSSQTGPSWASSRFPAGYPLERYELYAHTPSFQCNNVMGSWLFCYHPIIFSLNFVKGCSGKGLVKISAICSSVLDLFFSSCMIDADSSLLYFPPK